MTTRYVLEWTTANGKRKIVCDDVPPLMDCYDLLVGHCKTVTLTQSNVTSDLYDNPVVDRQIIRQWTPDTGGEKS